MPDALEVQEFQDRASILPILDVRTPSEYAHGHIPGALNLPLFSDDERAEIGTLYKTQGRDRAMLVALDRVGPKMSVLVDQARVLAPGGHVLIHCWRGGMRSEAVAWLLGFFGMSTAMLAGGYKAFRRHVLELLGRPRTVYVIGGMTGSGKTDILRALQDAGEHVIDLERIARHRGSVFGHLGMEDQPTQEQFENDLAIEWAATDADRPVWIEDESRRIGRIVLPAAFYEQKSAAPLALIERPLAERVDKLVTEYGKWGSERLNEAVAAISRRLGGERTTDITNLIQQGGLRDACLQLLQYYDAAYTHALERRSKRPEIVSLPAKCSDSDAAARVKHRMNVVPA